MGWDNFDDEIPADPSEFSIEVQQALVIFNILPDKIEGFNGLWLGKEMAGIFDLMQIYGVTEPKEVMQYISVCRDEYMKYYENQRKIRSKETG